MSDGGVFSEEISKTTAKVSYISENIVYSESYSSIVQENEDMTMSFSSDSGFTEINQKTDSSPSQPNAEESNSRNSDSANDETSEEKDIQPASIQSLEKFNDSLSSEDESEDEDYNDDDSNDEQKSNVFSWVRQQMQKGTNPRDIIHVLLHNFHIPEDMSDAMLWRIISLAVTPQRERLSHVRSLQDAVQHIKQAKNIIILTGAGVSVSCGIPDFRSRDGVYSRLSREYPNLPDPQAMFDIKFFFQDPRPFYKFAREIYPGQFKPSPSHHFIKKMEDRGVLLRNYTQNIDTLERICGITKLIECHGSFATASCTRCKFRINGDAIRDHILQQRIPVCFLCNPHQSTINDLSTQISESALDSEELQNLVSMGIFKPDIVFFGEELPDDFHDSIDTDRHKCDLLIVIGSSLKVKPVAMIPSLIASNVPQILINREPLPHMNFDVNLYGDSDVIINHLYKLIDENDQNAEELCWMETPLQETTIDINKSVEKLAVKEGSDQIPETDTKENQHPDSLSRLLPPNTFAQIRPRCYLFPGAEVLDNFDGESDESDDDFSDDDMDDENDGASTSAANEIIVPDIDNVSLEVPVPEVSPTPSSSSLSSDLNSQLQNDQETAENIQAIDANENHFDEPIPPKKQRIDIESIF